MHMWKSLSPNARFSILAFIVTLGLGLLSMGALGLALYYLVFPFLNKDIDSLHGDSAWPTIILVGMLWSFGFLFAGLAHHYLIKWKSAKYIAKTAYVFILWLWILILWYTCLNYTIVN
jgi:hypothetical protein